MIDTRDYLTKVALGEIPGKYIHSIDGWRFSIPTTSSFPIWIGPASQIFQFTDPDGIARIDRISSSDSNDIGTVLIDGLDEDWNRVIIENQSVNGQNKVSIPGNLIRINSIVSNFDLTGNIYVYEDTSISGGIPGDLSKVKGYVSFENNIMRCCWYSVPANMRAILHQQYDRSILGATGDFFLDFCFRTYGGAKIRAARLPSQISASSISIFELKVPALFPSKTDICISGVPTIANQFGAFYSGQFVVEKIT